MAGFDPDGRHGDHDAQPHHRRWRSLPADAGMSSAFAMWKWPPTALRMLEDSATGSPFKVTPK
jgi:hypothetical protein